MTQLGLRKYLDSGGSDELNLATGQHVRVTCGPLRDLGGVVESLDAGNVFVNAGQEVPGLCICISPRMLAVVDQQRDLPKGG